MTWTIKIRNKIIKLKLSDRKKSNKLSHNFFIISLYQKLIFFSMKNNDYLWFKSLVNLLIYTILYANTVTSVNNIEYQSALSLNILGRKIIKMALIIMLLNIDDNNETFGLSIDWK